MAKKAEPKARKPCQRDEKGRFVSPINGQPVPEGRKFVAGDSRAKEMQLRGAAAKREKGDLRRLMLTWLEEDVANGKDGEKISGGQAWVRWVLKEAAKGNMKALEMIRDTAGYKPVDKVMVADVEPSVIAEVEQMVQEAESE